MWWLNADEKKYKYMTNMQQIKNKWVTRPEKKEVEVVRHNVGSRDILKCYQKQQQTNAALAELKEEQEMGLCNLYEMFSFQTKQITSCINNKWPFETVSGNIFPNGTL